MESTLMGPLNFRLEGVAAEKKISQAEAKNISDIIRTLYPHRGDINDFITMRIPKVSNFLTKQDTIILPIIGYEYGSQQKRMTGVVLTNSQIIVICDKQTRTEAEPRLYTVSTNDLRYATLNIMPVKGKEKCFVWSMNICDMKNTQFLIHIQIDDKMTSLDTLVEYYQWLRGKIFGSLPQVEFPEGSKYELGELMRASRSKVSHRINRGLPTVFSPESVQTLLGQVNKDLGENGLLGPQAKNALRELLGQKEPDEEIIEICPSHAMSKTARGDRADMIIITNGNFYAFGILTEGPLKRYFIQKYPRRSLVRVELQRINQAATPFKLKFSFIKVDKDGNRTDHYSRNDTAMNLHSFCLKYESQAEALNAIVQYQNAKTDMAHCEGLPQLIENGEFNTYINGITPQN